MESDPGLPILALLALLALHAFFIASEVAVLSVGKARLNQLSDQGHRSARLIAALAENPAGLQTSTHLAARVFGFLAVALAVLEYGNPLANWLAQLNPAWSPSLQLGLAAGLITALLALFALLAADLLPRVFAAHHPEPIARLASYPLTLFTAVAAPLTRAVVAVKALLDGDSPGNGLSTLPLVTEEQIKTLVDAGEVGGVLEEEEKEMIYSIFELGDTLAYEVMVPRIDIVALEADTSLQEALTTIVEAGHSRIPVYEDIIDNTIGILYAKDLLRCWSDLEGRAVRDILRPAYYVPETKPVDELLQELQQRKVHIAIVVDEYGGVAGLVTIEDILEEIVGEIQDEYDAEEPYVEIIGPDEMIFDGRIDLDDINDEMDIELPTDTSDTLGGLISASLGRVAVVGDRLQMEGVTMTVLSMHGRRIKKIQVTRQPVSEPEGAEAASSDTVVTGNNEPPMAAASAG